MSIIIRLQNLPWSANSIDIRRFFSGLSIPEGGVHIVGGEMGDAFIAFSTDEDARLAMAKDGGKIKDMQIKLLLSSRTEMMRVIEQARQQNMVVVSQPHIVPTQAPTLPIQQPARIIPAPSEPDRRRGRSPTPRHRSRERSPVRERRRSPDDRRSSKRDRSRSPGRSSRSFSRDMDRRSDRFKRDDRRYDDSRYRDDRRSARDSHPAESKKYSDADHVNSKSQLHATEGFRDMQHVYDAVQNTAMSGMYQYGSQQLQSQHSSVKSNTNSYSRPSSDSQAQLSQAERLVPQKTLNVALVEERKHTPSSTTYSHEHVPFHSTPFEQTVASVKESSAPDQQQMKPRRRSRFEPEFGPPLNEPPFAISESNIKVSNIQNQSSAYSINRAPLDNYSENRNSWSQETTVSSANVSWNDKRQPVLNPPFSASGDFLQVVPMDLDPPDMSPEPETYNENVSSSGIFPYTIRNASPVHDDSRRDNQTRGPLVHNSNQNRGPSIHEQNRGPPMHTDIQNRGPPMHTDIHNRGPPMHTDIQNRGPPMHTDIQNRGPPMHTDIQNRGPPMHTDIQHRGPPMHTDIQNRGPPMHADIQNRGPSMHDNRNRGTMHDEDPSRGHNDGLSRGAPIRNDGLNRAAPMRSDILNRGPPIHSDSQGRGPPIHSDGTTRGPPIYNESTSRGASMRNDDTNRGPPMHNDDPSRRPPMRSEDSSRRLPMRNEEQSRMPPMRSDEQSRMPPMRNDESSRMLPMRNEEPSRMQPMRIDDPNRRPQIRTDDPRMHPLHIDNPSRGHPIHDDLTRGTAMRNDDRSRGQTIRDDDPSRRQPMRNDDPSRDHPVCNDDPSRDRPVHNDDPSRDHPMRNDDQSRGPAKRNDDSSRGPPIRNDDQNRGQPMHDDPSKVPSLHNDDPNRGVSMPPLHNDGPNRGPVTHNDDSNRAPTIHSDVPNRGPSLHDVDSNREPAGNIDSQNMGPPRHGDSQNRVPSVLNESQNRVPPMHADRQDIGPSMQSDSQIRVSPVHNDNKSRVPSSLTVEVRGLPPDARIVDVLDLFTGISLPAANIRIEANEEGFEKAFIRFTSAADFEEALSRNRRFVHEGRCELVPCPAVAFDGAIRSQKPKPRVKPREEDLTIQVRGLPFACKDDDVVSFFDGLTILDLYIEYSPDGKASGIGFIEFGSHKDFRAALAMNGKMIGHRYITVSVASKQMMAVARGQDYIPKDSPLIAPHSDSGHPPINQSRPLQLATQHRPPVPQGRQPPSCIFMTGLPEGVTNRDIADFLGQVQVMPRAIHIMLRPDKMPSGDAYAEFSKLIDMETALEMDGKIMTENPVEVKPISFYEMSEILGRPVNLPHVLSPGGLLRTPIDGERPRRPLLPQGPGEALYRERLRMEHPMRGGRPRMDPLGRPPFGPARMRGPWPNRPRLDGRFPPSPADRGPKDFGSPGCVVSINNLHFRAGLEEILDFFQGYNITKDNVIRKYNENGQTTGEARVAFQNPRDAQTVVRELNQKPIMGRPLTLSVL